MEGKKEYKNLAVDPDLHLKIKTEAARRGLSIKDYVAKAHAAIAHNETDALGKKEKWRCTACNEEMEFLTTTDAMNWFHHYLRCPQCGVQGQWVREI